MKDAIIIGSGIAGMACAVKLAEEGVQVVLVSPFPSERSQSVMAAGGINAVLADCEPGDSVECHIKDTMDGGCGIAGKEAVAGLCENAEEIIRYLEKIGTVFSVDEDGHPARRAFGGQSFKRTCYCGSATGKQIVSALVMEVRRLEGAGMIRRRLWSCFHSALIKDGVCYGALLFDETTGKIEAEYADALVMAVGGQNALFGKTTGSTQCDGYAAGRLFRQGVDLKNLEFIQYHPTTLETAQKKMLVSEAVRGEGGRRAQDSGGAGSVPEIQGDRHHPRADPGEPVRPFLYGRDCGAPESRDQHREPVCGGRVRLHLSRGQPARRELPAGRALRRPGRRERDRGEAVACGKEA